MQQITLSRLQHTIRDWNDRFSESVSQMDSFELSYNFRIFSLTTQEDFAAFLDKADKRKKADLAFLARLKTMLAYISYLRDVLNDANQKFGISQKLVQATSLGRQASYLEQFINLVSARHASGFEQIKDVDFYKSVYTEDTKYYDLTVFLFAEADLAELRKQMQDLTDERQRLNDNIATLNQTHTVSIKSFDEFCQ